MSLKLRLLRHIYRRHMRWRLAEITAPGFPLTLDYPVVAQPRWGVNQPPLAAMLAWFRARDADYMQTLATLYSFREALAALPEDPAEPDLGAPCWRNGYFTGLDAIAYFGLLGSLRPARVLEVGSGHSTRLARHAIRELGLPTRLTSIDPQPRVAVDALCDEVIRTPLEQADLTLFEALSPGDILFIDNSHRVFQNSDATVFFLEVLPRLAPGIVVHVHDIFLPYDYPAAWSKRYYSEQYLLAALVQGGGAHLEPLLPLVYLSQEPDFSARLDAEWGAEVFQRAFARNRALTGGYPGTSLWLRTT